MVGSACSGKSTILKVLEDTYNDMALEEARALKVHFEDDKD
jgi:hypothetical protein